MLAMRRENDQIFGSTNSNAINNNTISATNDTVTDNCCSSSGYQDGKSIFLKCLNCLNIHAKKKNHFMK